MEPNGSHAAETEPADLKRGAYERSRGALCAIGPSLLLLDEPFGALDAKVRKNLRVWLRDLHDRMGLTSIFVTHDQAEAMEIADRVAVLRAGRIEQVDVPDRLYAEPASAFVHEFLGESVRFDCTVIDGCAHVTDVPGATFPARCPPGPAIALIRPHEIGLQPGAGPVRAVSRHTIGPLCRTSLTVGEMAFEVLTPEGQWTPCAGQTCGLDLSRARAYPIGADEARCPSKWRR